MALQSFSVIFPIVSGQGVLQFCDDVRDFQTKARAGFLFYANEQAGWKQQSSEILSTWRNDAFMLRLE